MSARVAARKLPADMPAFFRKAEVELGYLCPEPDRWRNEKREAALKGLHDRDHIFKLEDMTQPLPPQRYDFLMQYFGKPKPGTTNGATIGYRDLGFAPYAMAERSEMLTVNFMLWRQAPQKTAIDKRIKRQIEQNIIHIAGLLAHFITDNAQPLHTTIHGDGWNPRVENPNGYVGKAVHRRFETDYIAKSVEEKDFQGLVAPIRERGPWLAAALDHIREAHEHVEKLYAFDKEHPFGEGGETPEQKQFTCERLAHGSAALRDFWYSAWVKSAELAKAPAR